MPLYREHARDGRDQFGVSLDEYRVMVLDVYARRFHRPDNLPHVIPPMTEVAASGEVVAFVNHDRWLARCGDKCPDVQFIWRETLLYMCASCFNREQGYKWRRVVMPATRVAIESVLGHRAELDDRNWTGESVASLQAENRRKGETVPEA